MRYFFLAMIFTVIHTVASGQLFCTGPDSIIQKYRIDADRLAMRRIQNDPFYKDSIYIPKFLSDSFLNALIAVYNATTIPERDTIIDLLDIRTFPDVQMNLLNVAADSNLAWMIQLQNGIIPTGFAPVDSLLHLYNLTLSDYETWSGLFDWHIVTFRSMRNYNIKALARAFETVPEIYFAEPSNMCCDGNDITIPNVVGGEGTYLLYSYKWGDCPAGCTASRDWLININGCEVQLTSVSGLPLPFTSTKEEIARELSIFPNPFNDEICIPGYASYSYMMYDVLGNMLLKGISSSACITGLEQFLPGLYFLKVNVSGRIYVKAIFRN